MHSQTYANTYFQTDLEVSFALGNNKTLFNGNKGIEFLATPYKFIIKTIQHNLYMIIYIIIKSNN